MRWMTSAEYNVLNRMYMNLYEYDHDKNKVYFGCPICGEKIDVTTVSSGGRVTHSGAKALGHLARHVKDKFEKIGKNLYNCKICGVYSSNRRDIILHIVFFHMATETRTM